ncbi:glycosyltransferase family 4 protein [Comamonas sp. JC664]|uniref:glycosyltransferase family 4 protein n=1 Tax=Comamonas sp. JC664 TaxID=2801917 RepID=UPI001747EC6F|nr:glycosyltransferase family 4 protein [Comamonas sp. JC664]MBL0699149.1 glycosyltransferase family 4 protein [Comamonas sp. JC664]GHH01708.1 glycosyl transferase [Comamonas sp. KCTC 72670]
MNGRRKGISGEAGGRDTGAVPRVPGNDVTPGRVRRVLMTADAVGDVWTYALELTRALAPHGVEVTLATMGAPLSQAQWAEARGIPNLAIEEGRFRLEWMEDPWEDVRSAGEWLLDLEHRLRPDVVHLNGYAHGALPWLRKPLVVGHACSLSWWRAVRGEGAPGNHARYREAVAEGLRAAGRVVTPSMDLLTSLQSDYGPLVGAEVIPHARRADRVPPRSEREPFILSVGSPWDEAKNIAALEAAAPRVGWPVKLAGDARHPSERKAEPRGLQWMGHLEPHALAEWMSRASVFVLPARYAPFGLTALEAALSGCALVLSDLPSLREVWGDGAACFVPPDDVHALVATLELLRKDPALRTRLALRARAWALTYTPRRMASQYLSVYARLAEAENAMAPAGHSVT